MLWLTRIESRSRGEIWGKVGKSLFYWASRTHFWLKQHLGSIERMQGRMRREWRRPRRRWTRVTVAIVEKRTTDE